MSKQPFSRRGRAFLAGLLLAIAPAWAEQPVVTSLSIQLLEAYFDTAGVCTTSSVKSIRDDTTQVTIEIEIEAATRKSLQGMDDAARDDWFSLHCPPEIQGVWHQAHPPDDIRVIGLISADETHELSCIDYQNRAQAGTRRLTLSEKIQLWIKEKMD